MWHVGIDLHLQTVVIAAVNDAGEVRAPLRVECADTEAIQAAFEELRPFRAVIEATGTYRWLHRLLSPMGTVLLAHPLRLRAMVVRRSKSDRLDSQLLAQLLRLNQIPLAHIPSESCQMLRDLTRYRAQLGRQVAQASSSSVTCWRVRTSAHRTNTPSDRGGCTGSAGRNLAWWGTRYGTTRWSVSNGRAGK